MIYKNRTSSTNSHANCPSAGWPFGSFLLLFTTSLIFDGFPLIGILKNLETMGAPSFDLETTLE